MDNIRNNKNPLLECDKKNQEDMRILLEISNI